MDTLNKHVKQIYHAPDSKIPAIAEEFFSHLVTIIPECASIQTLNHPISVDFDMWRRIQDRFVALKDLLYCGNDKFDKNDSILGQLLYEFEKEAKKRGKRLAEVGTFLEAEARPYYLELTNITPKDFGGRIKQF